MNRPIRRLAVMVFAGFGVLILAVTWLQVIDVPAIATTSAMPALR